MISALILVGGRATRVQGYPKYLFTYEDKTFLERQIEELSRCTDEILIVCRDAEQVRDLSLMYPIQCISDIRKDQGPAGGIHAGMWHAQGTYVYVTACDMPFVSCKVIRYLVQAAQGYDAAVPIWKDGKYEPLCAVYRRNAVRDFFKSRDERRLSVLIRSLNTKFIPVEELHALVPDQDIFYNVNDMQSLSKIKK